MDWEQPGTCPRVGVAGVTWVTVFASVVTGWVVVVGGYLVWVTIKERT